MTAGVVIRRIRMLILWRDATWKSAPNSTPQRASLIRTESSLIARFNSLEGPKNFPVKMRRELVRKSLIQIPFSRGRRAAEPSNRRICLYDRNYQRAVLCLKRCNNPAATFKNPRSFREFENMSCQVCNTAITAPQFRTINWGFRGGL